MYDCVIIGSGIAGLFTALLASKHGRVLVITKAGLEESNTRYAQGGIAAATHPTDSPAEHFQDTIVAGAGLCEPAAVDVLTRLGPARIGDLIRFGVEFDREGGELARGREAAHGRNRILHAGGDATGARVEFALCRTVRAAGVDIRERHFVTDLLVERGRAVGIRAIDPVGRPFELEGRHVILASGGSGQLFRFTTNPEVATGDGLATAYRAGAALADVEFYQFHPTALALPGAPPFLISEAVRGEGGILRDARGRAFMGDYDSRRELAPRDIVSRAVVSELARSGDDRVYLDVTHLPAERIRERFPTIVAFCAERGLDVLREPIPVAPAAHYQMGGVLTNTWGETTLPGLYACGEVAASGVHGANRLASNSLLEGMVFGERIVRRTLGETAPEPPSALLPPLVVSSEQWAVGSNGRGRGFGCEEAGAPVPAPSRWGGEDCSLPTAHCPLRMADVQHLMWDQVGLVRTGADLAAARATLGAWAKAFGNPIGRAERELANLVLIGRLMAEAAYRREESRGAHFRSDFPTTDERWRRRIVMQMGEAAARSRELAAGIVTG